MKLSGFSTFIGRSRGERVGHKPKTGGDVSIEKRKVMVFKPSTVLKVCINGEASYGEDQVASSLD